MNNFDRQSVEVFTGPLTWFGARSPKIASLKPTIKQIGLTSSWPEWMKETGSASGARALALLTNMLFPENISSLQRVDFNGFAINCTLEGEGAMREWISEQLETESFVGPNRDQLRRWAMVGVAPQLAIGAFAIEKQVVSENNSEVAGIQTVVSVLPIANEFLPIVSDLCETRVN